MEGALVRAIAPARAAKPYFFFAPTRLMLLIASGVRPDFSAISRSCSMMIAARRLVAVEPAEQLGRHAPVGALRVVLIDDIEEGKLAFGIGPGFFGHAGFWSIRAPLSKKIAARNPGEN